MKIIAHRGARGLAPENTIAAIKEGLKHRPDMVEFDVRVTKDGVPVLHHDPNIKGGSRISRTTFKDLRAQTPDLATLDEALAAINRQVPVYLEIKPFVPVAVVAAVLEKHIKDGWAKKDFYIASFSQRTLRQMQRAIPGLNFIVNEHVSGLWATYRARQLGTHYLAFKHSNVWSGFVRALHKRGWKVIAYTVNNPDKAERFARWGLYGIVTDYPDRFAKKGTK